MSQVVLENGTIANEAENTLGGNLNVLTLPPQHSLFQWMQTIIDRNVSKSCL